MTAPKWRTTAERTLRAIAAQLGFWRLIWRTATLDPGVNTIVLV
jgi:hypothetical protein